MALIWLGLITITFIILVLDLIFGTDTAHISLDEKLQEAAFFHRYPGFGRDFCDSSKSLDSDVNTR